MPRIADAARRPPLPVHVRPGGDRLVRPEPPLKDFRNHSCSNSVRMRGLSVNWPRSHHTGQGTAAEYWPSAHIVASGPGRPLIGQRSRCKTSPGLHYPYTGGLPRIPWGVFGALPRPSRHAHACSPHRLHSRLPHHADTKSAPHPRQCRSPGCFRGGNAARSASRMARSASWSQFQFFFLAVLFPQAN